MLTVYAYDAGRLVARATPIANEGEPPALWYDLVAPMPHEIAMVERALGVSIPTREEMEEIELSSRLYSELGAEVMTVTGINSLDGDEPMKSPLTFLLKNESLVTVRYVDSKPFTAFCLRAARGSSGNGNGGYASGEAVMLGLLESLIDRLADALERLGTEVDTISHEVFRGPVTNTSQARDLQAIIQTIGRKGEMLTMIREGMVSITRLLTYHTAQETDPQRKNREARQKSTSLQRDVAALSDHATFLSGKVNFLLDATLGLINLEQNQIIKIFSVAAVVFLPPTLVASIYGMNFHHMPELDWHFGYPVAIILMVFSAMLPYLFFKRKGWL